MQQQVPTDAVTEGAEPLEVWIDQDLCTGDGICAQYAPDVFELDIDGLAYVKSADDELLQSPGATTRCRCPSSRMSSTRRRNARVTVFMYGAFRTVSRCTALTRSEPPRGS